MVEELTNEEIEMTNGGYDGSVDIPPAFGFWDGWKWPWRRPPRLEG